jgi:flagellar biosynthesis/type III secretory pathway protein FliH
MRASLADILFYEALPPETRTIIERVWAERVTETNEEKIRDAYSEGHAEGYSEGYDDAKEKAYNDKLDSLCTKCGSDVSTCFDCARHGEAPRV